MYHIEEFIMFFYFFNTDLTTSLAPPSETSYAFMPIPGARRSYCLFYPQLFARRS